MIERKMILFASFQVIFFSLGLLVSYSLAFPRTEVEALTSFKRSTFDDPILVLSNWNSMDSKPCNWRGISCSIAGDHVIKLNISYAALRGFVVPEFHQLSNLRELVLHGNLLMGAIPKEIGLLKNLQVLDLGSNQLTGSIPPEIGTLTSITKINLQSNGLTGGLPYELGNLKYLEELRLDRNKFRGTIPAINSSEFRSESGVIYASEGIPTGLCGASQLQVVNLSYNYFVGVIPKCLGYVPRSSFKGNCLQLQERSAKQRTPAICGAATPAKKHPGNNLKSKPRDDSRHQSSSSKPAWLLALEIVIGIVVGSLFVAALFTAFLKWKMTPSVLMPWTKSASLNDCRSIYTDPNLLKDVVRYSRQELEVACEDFSNIIGSSPFSVVYKGILKGGPEIAATSICIKEDNWTGYLELYFQTEVADLSRLDHKNVGKLLGYCIESYPFTRMLVFEYESNGTLHEYLHDGEGCQLSWTRRMNIAIGIARGLKYLHTEVVPPFTVPQLNSSSIYLTEEFLPKIVDFECWKTILARSKKSSCTISNKGAICILPNSLEKRRQDVEGNIYAFGIMLLEIISGRPPYSEEKGNLVDWAKEFLDSDVVTYIVDPGLKYFRYEDLKIVCEVVKLCLNCSSSAPPSMLVLCNMLENGVDLSMPAEIKAASLALVDLELSP